jgi:hypothetical protein
VLCQWCSKYCPVAIAVVVEIEILTDYTIERWLRCSSNLVGGGVGGVSAGARMVTPESWHSCLHTQETAAILHDGRGESFQGTFILSLSFN